MDWKTLNETLAGMDWPPQSTGLNITEAMWDYPKTVNIERRALAVIKRSGELKRNYKKAAKESSEHRRVNVTYPKKTLQKHFTENESQKAIIYLKAKPNFTRKHESVLLNCSCVPQLRASYLACNSCCRQNKIIPSVLISARMWNRGKGHKQLCSVHDTVKLFFPFGFQMIRVYDAKIRD